MGGKATKVGANSRHEALLRNESAKPKAIQRNSKKWIRTHALDSQSHPRFAGNGGTSEKRGKSTRGATEPGQHEIRVFKNRNQTP